ncbi:uncharacterized protein LOC133518881 [Cydia pomonella]|uniref:uncharacterized protein LOC133518881 n=1 Tax=Cydia pomonella TaxID=82600 RepID=UPI002ADDD3DD|nr:uncharacterized protein LOC133518881 [Cydia pomonella]
MLAVFFVCILLFIGIYDANNAGFKTVSLTSTPALETKMGLDLDFLAESMTTPPILHILTSRSKEEVKLSTDSALIITSNTFFYLFRAFVVDKLLRYCVYITKVQLHLVYSDSSIFLLWPIFFTSLYLDSIVTIPFSILIFVVDYFTFVITYQCLIEVIVCEWQVLKRWHGAVILYILANVHQQQWFTINNWLIAYGIRSATFTELLIITFLYPLSRLVEDTTFHNGIAPSFVAVISLRLVCLLYIVKFLRSSSLFGIFLPSKWKTGITYALVLILTAGLLVKLYDIVVIKKKNWKLIFVPVKEWGPFDLSLRLLRKKYDSSKYIQSQAPRDLSRYLIQKAEPNSYKLDLRYGLPPKSMLYVRP